LATIVAGRNPDPASAWLLKCVTILFLVVGLTWACMKRSGITWKRYGVSAERNAYRLVLIGLASGIVVAGVWAGIVWFWAPYVLAANPTLSLRALLLGTLATLAIGVAEEVGYRTYGLDRLEANFGPLTAVLLPSILFAAMHMTGGLPWLAALCVVGSSSVMYGSLMLATRSLPLVAAFHIANNLLQDAVIRTGEGSLFAPSFRAAAGMENQMTRIWLCILAVNVAMTVVIWRKRRPKFVG
jgi:membrane protease YdiL (CAAX protease family)